MPTMIAKFVVKRVDKALSPPGCGNEKMMATPSSRGFVIYPWWDDSTDLSVIVERRERSSGRFAKRRPGDPRPPDPMLWDLPKMA